MMSYLSRIENDVIRVPLLSFLMPFYFLKYVIHAWLPESLGGNSNRKRLLELDFYGQFLVFYSLGLNGDLIERD